jgi:RecA-family ATPase
MTENEIMDRQVVRLDWLREQPAGVQRFLKAMRRAGDDDPLKGPQWVIPGILQEGQTAMCPGPPGSGKSFAMLDWQARIACGLDFLGKPVMQGGAVYVTGEGQTGLAKRIAALSSEFELTGGSPFLYVRTMPRLLDQQEVRDFVAALKIQIAGWSAPLRVIAFDTFNRAIVGGSENEGKDVAKLLDADRRIKDAFGCATIFAHHPGKAEGNDIRGHSSLRGILMSLAFSAARAGHGQSRSRSRRTTRTVASSVTRCVKSTSGFIT